MMEKLPSIDKLKEAIDVAEKYLDDIEEEDTYKIRRKRKRVTKALESAYEILNNKEYTEKEIDKKTDDIWASLIDDDPIMFIFIFILGIFLSAAVIFVVFQAYSFIEHNLDPEIKDPDITEEVSSLVKVNYIEENVVSLYNQMSVADNVGLQNPPQEFTISNSSEDVKALNYLVHYSVNIVPMNDPKAKLLNEKHIKYKYTYKDSHTGKFYESAVGTLADLKTNPDGSLLLTKGTQAKDSKTDFKVIFWVSSHALNSEQGSTYTFAFKVNAAIAKS